MQTHTHAHTHTVFLQKSYHTLPSSINLLLKQRLRELGSLKKKILQLFKLLLLVQFISIMFLFYTI